jgi:DnaJ-class molecular chaperone
MFKLFGKEKEVEITCTFCKGTGRDPFAIMSPLATCYVCGGKKKLRVASPNVRCSYCWGRGVSPVGARNACPACYGIGLVPARSTNQTCPRCSGTGEDKSGLYCLGCHGSGVVSLD